MTRHSEPLCSFCQKTQKEVKKECLKFSRLLLLNPIWCLALLAQNTLFAALHSHFLVYLFQNKRLLKFINFASKLHPSFNRI